MKLRAALRLGRWDGEALLLPVRVQPRSRRLGLGPANGARLKLSLTAPPVDGKANAQARELLADAFGVPTSRVTLERGETGRDKIFRIAAPARIPPEVRGD